MYNHHLSNSFIKSYFSAIQGHSKSKLVLGYKYYFKIGVPGNCSTAALYYKDVGDLLYADN